MNNFTVHCGDCLDVMPTLPSASVDSIVTDPPYGLSFMGKQWDHGIPGEPFWREALRVAKPGAFLLAFGGTRTFHRLTCAIEDAGWEIRDCVMWVYGSGFPKSHNVSKAIDKAAGAEREVVGQDTKARSTSGKSALPTMGGETVYESWDITAPATDAARQWQGWGTALKPAWEPIIVARKSLVGTVAENVAQHGTGAINVDGCRVPSSDEISPVTGKATLCGTRDGYDRPWKHDPTALAARQERANAAIEKANTLGRWPANLIHDGSDEVVGLFPQSKSNGEYKESLELEDKGKQLFGSRLSVNDRAKKNAYAGDSGSAARFFYCAKASKADRDEGCEGLEEKRKAGAEFRPNHAEKAEQGESGNPYGRWDKTRNHHPTVKPTNLMRYLCRLVTPPDGIVLDPFTGSGSTGKAAVLEGFNFIGIERDPEYAKIAEARIDHACDRVSKSTTTDLFNEKDCSETNR